jgi:hypothetical protein
MRLSSWTSPRRDRREQLIFNILIRLMRKALQELLLIGAILEKYSQCEKYFQKALQYTLNSDQCYSALN